jgi:hypothetical protein
VTFNLSTHWTRPPLAIPDRDDGQHPRSVLGARGRRSISIDSPDLYRGASLLRLTCARACARVLARRAIHCCADCCQHRS